MKVNKFIRVLILSDFYLLSGWGFVSPIFAIFLTEQISGGDVRMVGFAAAIYWGVKSILQIPLGIWLDKYRTERDDLVCLVVGTLLIGIVPFGFIFSSLPWHIYLLQAVYGIGMALNIPAWGGLFTRNIDKGQEAMEWSLESTAFSVGTAITGALGGTLAFLFGFKTLFIIAGIFIIIGGLIPLIIYKNIKRGVEEDHRAIREKL